MGQGQIQHAVAATETGWVGPLAWPRPFRYSVESGRGSAEDTGEAGSCCSSKAAKANTSSPEEGHKASDAKA